MPDTAQTSQTPRPLRDRRERVAITPDELIAALQVAADQPEKEARNLTKRLLTELEHVPRVRERVELHWCNPGCTAGCDIGGTRKWVSPVEISHRRAEISEKDLQGVRDWMAKFRKERKGGLEGQPDSKLPDEKNAEDPK